MRNILIITLYLFIALKRIWAFDYFNKSIDYWNEKHANHNNHAKKHTNHEDHISHGNQEKLSSQKQIHSDERTSDKETLGEKEEHKEKKKFHWEPYLNPKTTEDLREVFREGEHTPPSPLLEVARNPTEENIKNWFALVKTKNRFLSRLNQKMSDYLKKARGLDSGERNLMESQKRPIRPRQSIDYHRFRLRMYFESSCPHCRRMMGELTKLKDMGFYVELRQIDANKEYIKGLPFLVIKASQEEIREKKIDSWPTLLIGDQKHKVIYRIHGFQTAENILLSLQKK